VQTTATNIRVGVIGTGLMGEVHARSLRARVPGAELVAVSDFDIARATALGTELGVTVYATGEELLAANDIDAVVIASPDVTHADYAVAAIRAGKFALCEKPLAETQQRSSSVVDAEISGGRRLIQVGFMREFDPAHVAVREAVASGRLGRPIMFRGTHVNPAPVGATSVQRAISQSLVHDIHSARFLTGREIVNVFTRWVPLENTSPPECRLVTVSCTFDDGSIGLLDVNIEAGYGYAVSAEIIGATGTISTVDPSTSLVRSTGQLSTEIMPNWATRFAPAYLAELEAWIGSIHSGVPVGPSAFDGYIANVIADACIESALSGRPVDVVNPQRADIYH
jgi:myo-inositol 2-dehydrogenase / D-chiro-inositol 1-dehydrogenase